MLVSDSLEWRKWFIRRIVKEISDKMTLPVEPKLYVDSDGAVLLEYWGDCWRFMLSLEGDYKESGWHLIRIDQPPDIGPLDELDRGIKLLMDHSI